MAQKQLVNNAIKDHKVMVFSKTYCGYCRMAKTALSEAGIEYEVMELDRRSDGSAIQQYLSELTGGSSVPRVFINGKFIGGGTETRDMQRAGKLIKLVNGEV